MHYIPSAAKLFGSNTESLQKRETQPNIYKLNTAGQW